MKASFGEPAGRYLLLGVCVLALTAQSLPVGPTPSFGLTYRQPLYVNSASFSARFLPSMVERIVGNVSSAWSEYGSARRAYVYQGASSQSSCMDGRHVVRAVSGILCNPFNCDCSKFGDACYSGYNYQCGAGSEVVINLNSGISWAPGIWAGPLQTALTGVIAHELGHNEIEPALAGIPDFPGHVPSIDPGVPEVMNYDSEFHSGTDFGVADIEYAANWVGSSAGQDPIFRYRQQTSGFPIPQSYPWNAVASPGATGWGGFDVAFGYVGTVRRSSVFRASPGAAAELIDIDESSGSFPAGSSSLVTRRSPTSLYDPDHKQWWLFVNERGLNEGEPFHVHVYRSSDRLNWLDLGILQAPSQRIARTRHPVGVAYEATTQQVVVMYTNALVPALSGALSGCGDVQHGCNHELIAYVLPWNATSANVPLAARHRFSSSSSIGLGSMGSPAVACGAASLSGMNCEALFVGMDAMLSIHSVAFKVVAGGIASHGDAVNTGGLTDARLSYRSHQGKLIAACVGTGNTVYTAAKAVVGAGMAWTEIRTSAGGASIPARRSPFLIARPEGTLELFLVNY